MQLQEAVQMQEKNPPMTAAIFVSTRKRGIQVTI